MPRIRTRLLALLGTALIAGGVLAGAAPAQAVTWDQEPVRATFDFTVAGKAYTLRDVSIGTETRTIHIGEHSGPVFTRYRLTFKDDHGTVLARVERGLYKQSSIIAAFSDRSFKTVAAFQKAKHDALTIDASAAKARYLKALRIESVAADLESSVSATLDYLDALPAGTEPDFDSVTPVHSSEYRGSVTISGTDAKHWSVVVRDTQDGYGEFYDAATGSGSSFRF